MTTRDASVKLTAAAEYLSPDEIISRGKRLVPMLKARAEQTEKDRRVSPEVIEMMHDTGIFRIFQPKTFGGLEYGFTTLAKFNFVVAGGCGSTAWCTCLSSAHNWIVSLYPLEAQQEVWADPKALLAGSYMPIGKAIRRPGGYGISGAWPFSSNSDNCSWFIVGAMLPPEGERADPVPAWFLIPASQATVRDTWFSSGLSGTGSNTIAVPDEIFVPDHRVLTVPQINSTQAPGTSVNTNPLYRLTFTGSMPVALATLPIGMALGAIDDFTEMARTKTVAQAGGPPAAMKTLPPVQLAIGEASAAADAASALLMRDLTDLEAGLARGVVPDIPERILHRRNHGYAVRQAAHAVNTLFEALGASGGDLSNPVQRAWRDVNVAARHISLNWPTVGSMYAQEQLGLPPKGTF